MEYQVNVGCRTVDGNVRYGSMQLHHETSDESPFRGIESLGQIQALRPGAGHPPAGISMLMVGR